MAEKILARASGRRSVEPGEIVVADAGSSLHDGDRIKTMFAEDLDRTRVR